jgi:signal transduction histidine kinase
MMATATKTQQHDASFSGDLQEIHKTQLLLGLAPMDDPSFHPTVVLVDPIRDVIAPLLFGYTDKLNESGQTCEVHVSRPGMLVWADRGLLTNIIDNLITYAVKQGDSRGKILIKMAERGTEDEITFWYNGQTSNSEDLETLFECPSNSNDTRFRLYVARKMVSAHGGRMWADSRPGTWVCFTFTLPKRIR